MALALGDSAALGVGSFGAAESKNNISADFCCLGAEANGLAVKRSSFAFKTTLVTVLELEASLHWEGQQAGQHYHYWLLRGLDLIHF